MPTDYPIRRASISRAIRTSRSRSSRLLPTGSLFAATVATETRTRRALHEEFLTERVAQGRGGLVKVRGETVTSVFYRIGDALATAIGAQRALVAWSASRRIEPPLQLAMGVHAGPVTAFNGEERDSYTSDARSMSRIARE